MNQMKINGLLLSACVLICFYLTISFLLTDNQTHSKILTLNNSSKLFVSAKGNKVVGLNLPEYQLKSPNVNIKNALLRTRNNPPVVKLQQTVENTDIFSTETNPQPTTNGIANQVPDEIQFSHQNNASHQESQHSNFLTSELKQHPEDGAGKIEKQQTAYVPFSDNELMLSQKTTTGRQYLGGPGDVPLDNPIPVPDGTIYLLILLLLYICLKTPFGLFASID